jgi:signal peptidase I
MPDDSNPLPPESRPTDAITPGAPVVRPGHEGVREGRPEIVLNPKPVARTTTPAKKAPASTETKDSFREVIETVVFVVVLVLLLKTFLAEAFVIPTGSMATTLLGYHREVNCQKCGYPFLVNASKEADPQESYSRPVVGCTCPNCEYSNQINPPIAGGGR